MYAPQANHRAPELSLRTLLPLGVFPSVSCFQTMRAEYKHLLSQHKREHNCYLLAVLSGKSQWLSLILEVSIDASEIVLEDRASRLRYFPYHLLLFEPAPEPSASVPASMPLYLLCSLPGQSGSQSNH